MSGALKKATVSLYRSFNRLTGSSQFGKMKLCAMQQRNRDRAGQQTSYSNGEMFGNV